MDRNKEYRNIIFFTRLYSNFSGTVIKSKADLWA
jgi:hypothetical protein